MFHLALKKKTALFLKEPPSQDDPSWEKWMKLFCKFWYYIYFLDKPGGGQRVVEQPLEELKEAQKELLVELEKFKLDPHAYASKGKGYIENALQHKDSKEFLRIDLKNFYPSCTYEQLMNSIQDEELKSFIKTHAALCFVKTDTLHLATGSSLSPRLASLALKSLDEELSKRVEEMGGVYTRYLDDISISFQDTKDHVWKRDLRNQIVKDLEDRGWTIHFDKTGWVNPLVDSVTITGVDIREEPKVTTKYIKEKMRPALNKEAERLSTFGFRKKFWAYKTIQSQEDFLVNLSPKVKGEMAYIKAVSEKQYAKLVAYFYKRVDRIQTMALKKQESKAFFSSDKIIEEKDCLHRLYRMVEVTLGLTSLSKVEFNPIFIETKQLQEQELPFILAFQLSIMRNENKIRFSREGEKSVLSSATKHRFNAG